LRKHQKGLKNDESKKKLIKKWRYIIIIIIIFKFLLLCIHKINKIVI
jgi:hypothetical protein